MLSVALSLGSPPAGVTRRLVTVEPGLSSPLLDARERPPGRLAQARRCGSEARGSTRSEAQERDQPRAGLAVGDAVDALLAPVTLEGADDNRGGRVVGAARRAVVAKARKACLQREDAWTFVLGSPRMSKSSCSRPD